MKRKTKISVALLSPFFLVLFLCLALFVYIKPCLIVDEEIGRVSSPDSALDALIIRTNPGGAMSSFVYRVFIVPAGDKHKRKYEVFQGSSVGDMQVKWREPRLLEIHYDKRRAEISHKDSWMEEEPSLTVEIRLVPHETGAD